MNFGCRSTLNPYVKACILSYDGKRRKTALPIYTQEYRAMYQQCTCVSIGHNKLLSKIF